MAENQSSPTRQPNGSQLGGSWMMEGDEDGQYEPPSSSSSDDPSIDLTDDDDDDQIHEQHYSQIKQHVEQVEPESARSKERPKPSPSTKHQSCKIRSIDTEPELIMPSIHENMGSWTEHKKPRKRRATPQDSRQSKTSPGKRGHKQGKSKQSRDWIKTTSNVIMWVLKDFAKWLYEVAGMTLNWCKTPIALLLAVYVLLGTTVLLRNLVTSSVYSALSPICRIPGSSLIKLPMCKTSLRVSAKHDGAENKAVQFDELMTVQSKFDEVLEASAGGVSLPLDMKRGETSIRDLRTVVRHSSLRSKNELILEFDGFIETARIASWELQKFNSHVSGSVDKVLATARWTRRVLEDISIQDASQGAISSFFNGKILAPFQPIRFTESALVDQYIQHSRTVEDQINRLVSEAQALLSILLNMEERLDLIHDIAVRDDLKIQGSKEEVLSELWTLLGGNSKKLGKLESQLKLLKQVNTYRQTALAHVSGTLVKLQAMSHDLEDLRERVGGVELVPLHVHIENIEMGVERLEQGKIRARELEDDLRRNTLDRGDGRGIEGG